MEKSKHVTYKAVRLVSYLVGPEFEVLVELDLLREMWV